MTRGTPFGKTTSPFNDISRQNPTRAQKNDPFKPTKLELPRQSYEYKEYKPTHVGMYGEKQKEKNKPAAKPSEKPSPRTIKPDPERAKQTKVTGRKIKTFKFYEMDIGPDIKVGKTGPDMPVKEYKYRDPDRLHKPYMEKPFREPTNPRPQYETKKIGLPKKHEDYKLTEQNNLGMRHWHYGFVDDTIMRRENDYLTRSELVPKTPQQKPVATVKPVKNKENKKPQTPVKAEHVKPIVAPVPVPVPKKKKLVDSYTQHVPPKNKTSETQTKAAPVKTFGTQYEKASSRHMNVQTDTPHPQLPPVIAAGAVMAAPSLNKVKSKSVQATEPEKKVAAAGTQYTGPTTKQATMQTSPVAFAAPAMIAAPKHRRSPSPEVAYTETLQTREWSPEKVYRAPSPEAAPQYESNAHSDSRWTPPPVVPVVPVVVPVRNTTPPRCQYTPPHTYSPKRTPRQVSPPRHTSPRRDTPLHSTPPRRDSMYRTTPPNRLKTPPYIQTPTRMDSPTRWQSPTNNMAPTPERTASPPRTFAPVVVPVTNSQRPAAYQAQQYSPDNYRSPPPVVPVQQEPQSRDPYVYDPNGNQSYARAQNQPTLISPTQSPLQDPFVSSKPPSPEKASPIMSRDTNYPFPSQTQSQAPPAQQPFFTPHREELSPQNQSPPYANAFQGYHQPSNRQMRLPPEVNACIEAYDNVREDPVRQSGESLPSVKRTMQFA